MLPAMLPATTPDECDVIVSHQLCQSIDTMPSVPFQILLNALHDQDVKEKCLSMCLQKSCLAHRKDLFDVITSHAVKFPLLGPALADAAFLLNVSNERMKKLFEMDFTPEALRCSLERETSNPAHTFMFLTAFHKRKDCAPGRGAFLKELLVKAVDAEQFLRARIFSSYVPDSELRDSYLVRVLLEARAQCAENEWTAYNVEFEKMQSYCAHIDAENDADEGNMSGDKKSSDRMTQRSNEALDTEVSYDCKYCPSTRPHDPPNKCRKDGGTCSEPVCQNARKRGKAGLDCTAKKKRKTTRSSRKTIAPIRFRDEQKHEDDGKQKLYAKLHLPRRELEQLRGNLACNLQLPFAPRNGNAGFIDDVAQFAGKWVGLCILPARARSEKDKLNMLGIVEVNGRGELYFRDVVRMHLADPLSFSQPDGIRALIKSCETHPGDWQFWEPRPTTHGQETTPNLEVFLLLLYSSVFVSF
jgi:hypothetical protein